MRYLRTNELFRIIIIIPALGMFIILWIIINIPRAGDDPSLSVTWNSNANVLFLPMPVESWASWEFSIRQARPLTTTLGDVSVWRSECTRIFRHALVTWLEMYLWFYSRDDSILVRACEPPGNLDATVTCVGSALGYIWSGAVGQVSEN